jgi:cell fate regulator YaaT (PSP1 superfamily)
MSKIDNEKNHTVKIKFKGSRRELFNNLLEFPACKGGKFITEADKGEDLGEVVGAVRNNDTLDGSKLPPVFRKAIEDDLVRNNENRIKEKKAFIFCNQKISELNISMKLVDVEYRWDRKKLTFYYTADDRIDFRELVKALASEYKTRIEMRQISSREEMKRKGGIGACGYPLCCTNWLDESEPIGTHYVKEQNLPMNPAKISGCCGKLKCCFRYEHDTYSEILESYPPYGAEVKYNNKVGFVEKIDIFQKTISIRFKDDNVEDVKIEDFIAIAKLIE